MLYCQYIMLCLRTIVNIIFSKSLKKIKFSTIFAPKEQVNNNL